MHTATRTRGWRGRSMGGGTCKERARPIFPAMLSVTFLGTSAARPTVERNVSAMALVREGETLLFECGEGTQRQMMRYGVSFALSEIFFTHFHADHFLGVIGLIRTLDRKSTRLNSSHSQISYAVFCLKKKKQQSM